MLSQSPTKEGSRTLRLAALILLAGIVPALFVVEPALATAYTHTYDFADGFPADLDQAMPPANCLSTSELELSGFYTPFGGVGPWAWDEANEQLGTGAQAAILHLHFRAPQTVTDVQVYLGYEPFDQNAGFNMAVCDAAGDQLAREGSAFTSSGYRGIPGGPWEGATDIYIVSVWPGYGTEGYLMQLDDFYIAVDGDVDPWEAGLVGDQRYKPVSQADILSVVENNTAIGTRQNANVHSIGDGTIASISQFPSGAIVGVIDDVIGPSPGNEIIYENLQSVNGVVGDHISAGCVLGQVQTSPQTLDVNGTPVQIGILQFYAPTDIQEHWPNYPDSPSDTPCNAEQFQTENCINLNPNFAETARFWQREGVVRIGVDGVVELPPGAAIYQDVVLDPETAYLVTLYAASVDSTPSQLYVTFGEANPILHVSALQSGVFFTKTQSAAIAPGAADSAPSTYRFKISNKLKITYPYPALNPSIKLRFGCIGTTDPQEAPPTCYYADNVANFREDSWTVSDVSVTYTPPPSILGKGRYTVPNDEHILNTVSISAFSDQDTNFTLSIEAWGGAGAPLFSPYGRVHAYIRDSISHDTLVDIGTYNISSPFGFANELPFTLPEGTSAIGELVIENISGDINEDAGWPINVSRVCLSVDGGIWPGYDNTDTVAGSDACFPPIQPDSPVDNEIATRVTWVGGWLSYGWAYLGYILKCMIWGAIQAIITGVGQFGRWLGLAIAVIADWLWTGLGYLLTNLISAIIPMVNTIITYLLSLPFVQSLIDNAGLLVIWVTGLFDLVMGIFSLFFTSFRFLQLLFELIWTLANAVIAALSATSSVTVPIPDCTDPETAFYDACLVFDVLNFLMSRNALIAVWLSAVALVGLIHQVKKAWAKFEETTSI